MPDRIEDIYIWKIIERMLFTPTGEKEINKWFKQYHKFVLKLWGLNPEIHKGKIYSFNFNNKITISFQIPFDINKYSIDISQNSVTQSFHYDRQYLSELDLTDIFKKDIIDKSYIRSLKKTDISLVQLKGVLTSMLAHPALHFHLENISHNVRINFNTKNPFLFLYQLAFQLLDYKTDYRNSEKKQLEFERLVLIVEKNIQNQISIPSGILLNNR